MTYNQMTLRECVRYGENLIDSGKAMEQLNRFIALSNEVQRDDFR